MATGNYCSDYCAGGHKVRARWLQWPALLLLPILLYPLSGPGLASPPKDSREALDEDSPAWLRAVGRLQVPGNRYRDGSYSHRTEDCSATLIARSGSTRANIIITAWHCLEFYRDLSKPISFTLNSAAGEPISREAYRLADGGGMHSDWAILKLYQAVSRQEVAAMPVSPERADPELPITMAGYSRDSGIGQRGEQLTYDANCRITAQAMDSTDSDCNAYKGASGGAVVQVSARGEAMFCGVVSRGDSEGLSIYIPVSRFRSALNQHLN